MDSVLVYFFDFCVIASVDAAGNLRFGVGLLKYTVVDETAFVKNVGIDHSIFEQAYANPKIPGGIHTRYYAEITKVYEN